MSVVDKVIGALTPPETEEQRPQARAKARAAATPGDWLSMAIDHHEQIEAMLDRLKTASPDEAMLVQRDLMALFTGHGTAEETVLYPALAKDGQKGHATQAYTEQATTKMQFAELERLQPGTQDYHDKLGHIDGAIRHHIYEEESMWFTDMKESAPMEEQERATARFREEFERYMGGRGPMGGASGGGSPGVVAAGGLNETSGGLGASGAGTGGMGSGTRTGDMSPTGDAPRGTGTMGGGGNMTSASGHGGTTTGGSGQQKGGL